MLWVGGLILPPGEMVLNVLIPGIVNVIHGLTKIYANDSAL